VKTFKLLDHTGDLGIVVYGIDLEVLFLNAAKAFSGLLTDLRRIRCEVERTIVLESETLEDLMVAWLGELLYLFDAEGLVFKRFKVERLSKAGLKATAGGEAFQRERHVLKREIKAVTYHQVKVEKKEGLWQARVIFDL
jgi:SHS2 domain-containing protein